MAYSDSFPTQRPIFTLDAANAGRLDSRISYSRSTTGTYFGTEKVLSSENLLPYSENFGLWGQSGLISRTGGQTDPAGGSTGFTLRENSAGGFHRVYQDVEASGDLAFTVFSKQNSGTRYLSLTLFNANNDWVAATFDLAGSAPATGSGSSSSFSGLTATQTASGNGYYKCVIKATGSIIAVRASLNNATSAPVGTYGLPSYTGDGSSSIDCSFSSLSTTGATDYSFTNGQIAREYQTKLQTAAINAPRFEHSASDSASAAIGESLGLLVEGSSTNAVGYSDSLASWSQSRLTATNASAVGPTGSLNAALLTPSTDAGFEHIIYASSVTTSVTGTVTLSGYFKAAGYDYVTLGIGNTATGNFSHALFNLSTGAYVTNNSGGSNSYVSSSTESVGNGWWRLVATFSTSRSNEQFVIGPASTSSPTYDSNWGTPTYAGDGYSSVLATGIQAEVGKSFASSLITSNSGSETTRAVDSATMVTSSFYTGGPVTVVSETIGGQGNFPIGWAVRNSSGGDSLQIYKASGSATTSSDWRVYATVAGVNTVATTISSSASAGKIAVSFDTNDVAFTASGNAVQTDTSTALISGVNELAIGGVNNQEINGHVKRLAVFGEALSDTNLISLTK